jgi:hypothetical protein
MTDDLLPSPQHESPFQRIRRVNPAGNEYWSSREFAIFQNHGYMGLYLKDMRRREPALADAFKGGGKIAPLPTHPLPEI